MRDPDLSQAEYAPRLTQNNVGTLLNNHFKFVLEGLPDLTFFAQSIQIPLVQSTEVVRGTPFRHIKETGDHLTYSSFDVTFKVDLALKTYYSIYWWMCGYGFPRSYNEIKEFRAARASRIANPRPVVHELEKTTASVYLLAPDTNATIATFRFEDVFPIALGEMQFESTDSEPLEVKTRVTFATNGFDIILPE